ncbi:unnamed protein product [Diamesa serratosioi]
MMEQRNFSSVEEECHYWKELAKLYRQEKLDCQKEFEDFTDESRQLETELETALIQNDKQIRDLNSTINSLRNDNESLRHKLNCHERDASTSETRLNQLLHERETLKTYIRELEQKNDDLERTNRVVSESVSGFEAMLNQAYEKNALLEMEIDEKEQMQINLQRLMDEARDLKQELKIRNISLPPKPNTELLDISTASPVKNTTLIGGVVDNVSKINDINDSKNNNNNLNLSLNASTLDKTNTSLNLSLSETLQNISNDCNLSTNSPIAASTRVSALNIVADLLKKLDNLEAKLKSWKTQKPASQRLIESQAAMNSANENGIELETIKK